jgi:hypothetical protein
MDISRNLLLIMSIWKHVPINNGLKCLSYSNYIRIGTPESVFILNGIIKLQGILSKLFIMSILGTNQDTGNSFSIELCRKNLLSC